MKRSRILLNVVSFLAITALLVWFGATRFILEGREGRTLALHVGDASGLLPRSDVTVRGVPAGAVTAVDLADNGTAVATILLDPGVVVTEGTAVEITRRSPIGDLTVNLIPGDGGPLPDGAEIPESAITHPPDAERTIAVLAQVLSAVPPDDLHTLIEEAATALRGRGPDLATLSETGADLAERMLEVRVQLESLIRTGPEVLDVLAANAPTLADDITETAILADILRDRRFDLLSLSRNGARFAEVLGDLLASEKANFACMFADFGHVNATLATAENLRNLADVLDLNHYFFDGIDISNQKGKDGLGWFRVHFLPPQQPPAKAYTSHREPPDVFGGDGCRSRYGPGVGPSSQPGKLFLAPGSQLHRGA